MPLFRSSNLPATTLGTQQTPGSTSKPEVDRTSVRADAEPTRLPRFSLYGSPRLPAGKSFAKPFKVAKARVERLQAEFSARFNHGVSAYERNRISQLREDLSRRSLPEPLSELLTSRDWLTSGGSDAGNIADNRFEVSAQLTTSRRDVIVQALELRKTLRAEGKDESIIDEQSFEYVSKHGSSVGPDAHGHGVEEKDLKVRDFDLLPPSDRADAPQSLTDDAFRLHAQVSGFDPASIDSAVRLREALRAVQAVGRPVDDAAIDRLSRSALRDSFQTGGDAKRPTAPDPTDDPPLRSIRGSGPHTPRSDHSNHIPATEDSPRLLASMPRDNLTRWLLQSLKHQTSDSSFEPVTDAAAANMAANLSKAAGMALGTGDITYVGQGILNQARAAIAQGYQDPEIKPAEFTDVEVLTLMNRSLDWIVDDLAKTIPSTAFPKSGEQEPPIPSLAAADELAELVRNGNESSGLLPRLRDAARLSRLTRGTEE